MFYSHEILTSRKHGVATVWLVATLGSKSTLKKVSRRAILDVNVPKACETIADPESLMALRLQSSLLYGVSRVFSQQCGYILTDTQSLREKMNGTLAALKDVQIDQNVVQSSEQLNLPADICFNLDLDLGLDMSAFDLTSESIGASDTALSPHSLASSRSSISQGEGLHFPFDDVDARYDFSEFQLDADTGLDLDRQQLRCFGSDLSEPAIDHNPPFEIDHDGMLIDLPPQTLLPDAFDSPLQAVSNQSDFPDFGIDHIENNLPLAIHDQTDLVFNDDYLPANAEQSDVELMANPSTPTRPLKDLLTSVHEPENPPAAIQTADVKELGGAEAAQRVAKSLKALKPDHTTELSNRDLSDWQQQYLDTMAHETSERSERCSLAQARRIANYWVIDHGICRTGLVFDTAREKHPLDVLRGTALLEALIGAQNSAAGAKRTASELDLDDEDNYQNSSQRNRIANAKTSIQDYEMVRLPDHDEDGIMLQVDDDIESQVGRQMVPPLNDRSSSMPWNLMSSSHPGSAPTLARPGRSSSTRGLGFDIASALSVRRSRLTSASPLLGRGVGPSRLGSLDLQIGSQSARSEFNDISDPFANFDYGEGEKFELYGPAAAVSTQEAAQSQWLNTTLENEASNFFLFLEKGIESRVQSDDKEPTMTFAELVPPETNTYIVAAQALLHVLALATKNFVKVKQEQAFGDIHLSLIQDEVSMMEEEL